MDTQVQKRPRRRTPKFIKSILQSKSFRALLYTALASYVHIIKATTRWTIVGVENPQRMWDKGEPLVCAFWHGRSILMPIAWSSKQPFNMLASAHRDGDITENTLKKLGIKTFRGSTGNPEKGKMAKGGLGALRAMARILNSKESIGITPDGPRGPRMRASDGIAVISKMCGVPMIAASAATSSGIVLKGWDRMLVPLPFSRGAIVYGEIIHVPRDAGAAEIEIARAAIEESLNRITEQADRMVGRTPVEPAPLRAAAPMAATAS